jgi:hypothetical protein
MMLLAINDLGFGRRSRACGVHDRPTDRPVRAVMSTWAVLLHAAHFGFGRIPSCSAFRPTCWVLCVCTRGASSNHASLSLPSGDVSGWSPDSTTSTPPRAV